MQRGARLEFAVLAGLFVGLLAFPLLQLAGRLYMQEGFITFWIADSLGLPHHAAAAPQAASSTPEIAPTPVRARPLAIMVDNHPDARPQSGVAQADAVWEALVEGGLTRDMLIFRGAQAEQIGPVRSARPYFLLWAREADAVYAHFGGSDEALKDLRTGKFGLDQADGLTDGKTFWRDQTREAPHNAYTSTEKLRDLIKAEGWDEETEAVDASLRSALSATGTPAARLTVSYMQNGADAEFRWNASSRSYDLWRGGRIARDRDGAAVSPRTVAVLEENVVPIEDPHSKGLIGIANIGAGDATVFRDGMAFRGTWKKTSAADPTRVYGEGGRQIPFAAGQVWYAVVGANRGGGVQYDP